MRQRALVALSHTKEDAALLTYARLLADCGLLRETRFLHVPPRDCDAAHRAILQEAVEAEVQRYFGVPEGRHIGSCHVEPGERVDTVMECAQRWGSDVVVLGHRRARSGQRSLARRLAMISPCSVWLAPEGAPVRLRRILAPVDYSDHAADGLITALDVARAAKVEQCLALHVTFDESLDRSAEHQAAFTQRQRQAFEGFLRDIDTSGVPFEWAIEESPRPAQAILEQAANRDSDLIVMNTRGRSRAASILLGSVTTEVIVGTRVPILVVKHYGAMMGLFAALKESQFWNRPNPKSN
jgi:SulP family sulfate permease